MMEQENTQEGTQEGTQEKPQGVPDFAALDDAQFLAQDAAAGAAPDADGEGAPPEEANDAPQEVAGKETAPDAPDAPEVDYAAFYQKIMGQPIAANGEKLQLRCADEALQLMQMGANYTRKMQEIAPHRKAIAMLEAHGLLDAQKLDFLVALDKREPQAIKKYLADAKIDPLEIDMESAPDYQGGKYAPDERHIQFTDVLQQVSANPEGAGFLQHADTQWDAQTKQSIYDNPDVLPILFTQKQSGVYDLIAGEIGRQKTLGQLPQSLSFIEAYQRVGAQLHQSGAFEALNGAEADPAQQAKKTPAAAVRPRATVKTPQPTSGANAAAAAFTRGAGSAISTAGTNEESMRRAVAQYDDSQFNKNFRL